MVCFSNPAINFLPPPPLWPVTVWGRRHRKKEKPQKNCLCLLILMPVPFPLRAMRIPSEGQEPEEESPEQASPG